MSTVNNHPLKLLLIAPSRKEGEEKKPNLYEEWKCAIDEYCMHEAKYAQRVSIAVFHGRFGEIEVAQLQCDCIVSPANTYGIMDGGFDLELSRVLKGKNGDEWTLTNHCQTFIRKESNGYLSPGSCLIVPLPETVSGSSGNAWGTHSLAILPTMRTPEKISWNRDLVYNAMWALLNGMEKWNGRYVNDYAATSERQINTVLMTGLGTGTGAINARVCARQMILALKHFVDGVPEKPRWESVEARNEEVRRTYVDVS